MSFQTYLTGEDFLKDNKKIFEEYPIETSSFKFNAKYISDISDGFAVKCSDKNEFVIALRYKKIHCLFSAAIHYSIIFQIF